MSGRPPVRSVRRYFCAAFLVCVVGTSAVGTIFWPRPDPDRLWARAEGAFLRGRWDEARTTLLRIERLRPKTARDWILQAQLDSASGRTDEALRALGAVLDTDPLSAEAALMAGRLERARNRARAAEAHFRRAVALAPKRVEAHKELVYIYGMQNRRREVDAEFRALAKLTALSHHDLFTWSLTHFMSWSPDVATSLQAFVDADPHDRGSRLALAEALLDQPAQAGRVARLLDALPASDADALAVRVGSAVHEGRIDEAERLLAEGPSDHAGLARFRGRLALLRHDPAAAAEQFRIALSAERYDRVSMFDLGQALRLLGDEAAAEVYERRARRLTELYNLVIRIRSPERENEPPDLTKIASAFEAAGLAEEARHWYKLAISRDPLDPEAQRGLFRSAATRE